MKKISLLILALLSCSLLAFDHVAIESGQKFQAAQLDVTTSAIVLSASDAERRSVLIRNTDVTNTLYVGNSDVTASNGFPVKPNETITLYSKTAIYGISSAGTIRIATLNEN